MATLDDKGRPTLLNVVKRLKPDGGIESQMAEMLSKKLPLLEDIPWVEGNLPTGHRVVSRTGLPSPTWRRLNEGVDPAKSSTAQYDEACGMLEARSEVDVKLAELNGNAAAFRASEDRAFLEGFSQALETAIFYENGVANQERIHGFTPRYPSTVGYTSSPYVMKGTNGGANCHSIWLINWDTDKIFGIYPKGSTAGLKQVDMGRQYVEDSLGKRFLAYVTQFNWDVGLCVKDYRHAVRLQWDPDDGAMASTQQGLYLALQDMLATIQEKGSAAHFYMNRTSFMRLNAQLAANSANYLEYVSSGGGMIPSFQKVPIRISDALIPETAIT